MKQKAVTLLSTAIIALSLFAAPANAYTSGGSRPSSTSHATSSGSTRTYTSSGRSVAPPRNTGGSVRSSNNTSISSSRGTRATASTNRTYWSGNGVSGVNRSGRVSQYSYTNPATHTTVVYHYYSPSYYHSHPGFLAGMGAALLLDRLYGPNYTNPQSPLYVQPGQNIAAAIPPGYKMQNGYLVPISHHSAVKTFFTWLLIILVMIAAVVLSIWLYRKYKKQNTNDTSRPGSFARF